MKSQYVSILSADSSADALPNALEFPAAGEVVEPIEEVASYSARYQAYLSQQSQKTGKDSAQVGRDVLSRLVQVVVNLAIFVVFFLGFLTLFGFGLSRFSYNLNSAPGNVPASSQQIEEHKAASSELPASPRSKADDK